MTWFYNLSPVLQALIGTLFTWLMTAAGAALVFLFNTLNKKILNGMLGFAAGVMIAASYWSLLAPAIALSEELGAIPWLPAVVGFLLGGLFLWILDRTLPHLHSNLDISQAEGMKTSWRRTTLLISSITLHNIPEGLAVGVAFGAASAGLEGYSIGSAIALAIGIGIQNFPEGTAVSVPLRRENWTRRKSFMYGQLSGVVEPIAGVLGALLALALRPILPYALSFAAGAMIYVVIEELIPEAQSNKDTDSATYGAMIGFAVMMALDVALG